MDGSIKVWSPGSSSAEVLNPAPEFRWPEEDGPGRRGEAPLPVVTMFGCSDPGGRSVILLAGARERSVRLLELPSFTERGVLPNVRAVCLAAPNAPWMSSTGRAMLVTESYKPSLLAPPCPPLSLLLLLLSFSVDHRCTRVERCLPSLSTTSCWQVIATAASRFSSGSRSRPSLDSMGARLQFPAPFHPAAAHMHI